MIVCIYYLIVCCGENQLVLVHADTFTCTLRHDVE